MSGGHFLYLQDRIAEAADEVQQCIEHNPDTTPDEYGDRRGRGYSPETLARFADGVHALRLAALYLQRIDWLLSGDDGEEPFHERLAEGLAKLQQEAPDAPR